MQKLTNNQDGNKQGKVVIFVIVTDVRVRKVLAEGKMKAIVSVTLDDSFVIHDVKVVEGQNGLFVAMPSRKTMGRTILKFFTIKNNYPADESEKALLLKGRAFFMDKLKNMKIETGQLPGFNLC